MVIFISFALEILRNNLTSIMITKVIYYLVWGFTATLMGIYLSKKSRYKNITHFADVLLIFINIALIRSVSYSLLNNTAVSLGGATYQTAGYVFALGFGINLFYIVFGENYKRSSFIRTGFYRVLSILFLFIQIYGVIATGARGAMLLVLLYIFVIFILSMNNLKIFVKYSSLILTFGILILIFFPTLSETPLINNSWERIFAYLGEDGINWEGTSGRDEIYKNVLSAISDQPVMGYGLFNYSNVIKLPHNVFLEVILQGGILYLIIFLIGLTASIVKLHKIIQKNKQFLIYFILFCYPIIMLMFSGTYMSNGLFWFMVSFVYSLDIDSLNNAETT